MQRPRRTSAARSASLAGVLFGTLAAGGILAGATRDGAAAPAETASAHDAPADRVAAAEPARLVLEPGPALADLAALRTRLDAAFGGAVDATVTAIAARPGLTDVVDDVGALVTGELHGAADGARAWLVRVIAPIAPPPPDLTCLTTFPVPNHTTSGYGWRDDPINHHVRFHAGADIHAAHGTPVYAAGAGTVIIAGRQNGYGNVIYIDHGNGLITRYGHLSRILVKKGEVVDGAMEIGQVGATGRATGPHLHFEVRIDGRPVNPSLAMQVADLERTSPELARLVGLSLAPDVQSHWINEQDPPRGSVDRSTHRPGGSRPERRGRAPRPHLNS